MTNAPASTPVLVRMASPLRGRRGRGRNYWPGFLDDVDIDGGGFVTDSRRLILQEAFRDFYEQLDVQGLTAVILQRETPTGPAAPANPTPPYDQPVFVTDIRVDVKIGTQRRRIR